MTEREIAEKLLERVPDYKLGYVIAYMQGLIAGETSGEQDTNNNS